MKIICLKGGIGNQIFEYCRYLKVKESGEKVYIYYDSRRSNKTKIDTESR